jgi:chromate transporter
MILLQLFYEFFKTGLFAVGGGLATIPFLQQIADQTGWFTRTDLADMIAVSESTPGAMGVNMASYVGFTTYGVVGCIVATMGLVMPSIIVILIIAHFLEKFQENPLVQSAFYGLRPASTALIAAAGFSVVQISLLSLSQFQATRQILDLFEWKEILLAVVIYILLKKFDKHPVWYIGGAAAVGILFHMG